MDQEKQSRLSSIIALLVVLILAAAAGCRVLPGANSGDGEEPAAAIPSEELPTEAPAVTEEKESAGEVTEAEPIEETYPPPGEANRTARVGLQGTDPGTVTLASGDIQLVEFFAFW